MRNLILATDSYKLSHPGMLPADTGGMYSYLEAREEPASPYQDVVWFGLQAILQQLTGDVVSAADLDEAVAFQHDHMPGTDPNIDGWSRIIHNHGGRLPVRIAAALEGSVVPRGHALMTIESEAEPWLPGHLEPLLMKTWYPTTVATRLFRLRRLLDALALTSGSPVGNLFQVHDFGYRGASSEETAAIGGAAHLVVYRGSDTMVANDWLREHYGAGMVSASSVASSEHSIMTAAGRAGELALADRLIWQHQGQILSLVADSFDYCGFVDAMIDRHESITKQARTRLVIRPDSVTEAHPTPAQVVLWTLQRQKARLARHCRQTPTGHTIVPFPVLWGDGINDEGMILIATTAVEAGFAVENLVFGSGGWNMQRCNRDTLRFALKASARKVDGVWTDVRKDTPGKQSKAGRVMLYATPRGFVTSADQPGGSPMLQPVFENGLMLRQQTLEDIRGRVTAMAEAAVATPVGAHG